MSTLSFPVPQQRVYLLFAPEHSGIVTSVRDGRFTVTYDWNDPYFQTRPKGRPRIRGTYPLLAWSRFGQGSPPIIVEKAAADPELNPNRGKPKGAPRARR